MKFFNKKKSPHYEAVKSHQTPIHAAKNNADTVSDSDLGRKSSRGLGELFFGTTGDAGPIT